MELNRKVLLSLDPDRLLHNFRVNAGLPSTAGSLGGWEGPESELRGHFTGHYLSACAMMYAATGDILFKERADIIIAGLAECQASNGYLSAFPETFFDRLESGRRVWAPYYVLHKLLAGLLAVHGYCGNQQALDVARRLGDWIVNRNSSLSDKQMDLVLATEHGGINEALADLYALTGDAKYMATARRFIHSAIINPAARKEDRLNGLHANTQVPKFIGAARIYELNGGEELKHAAQFFWDCVTRERAYVTGGASEREHFTAKQQLSQSLSIRNSENCVAYNMLRLTHRLFLIQPLAEYGDYYERTLYNQILASQNPADGGICYFVPLQSGSQKIYSLAPTCCTGTGIESHAKHGQSIYYFGDDTLYVNLFIASQLDWPAKGVRLKQQTLYPEEPRTQLQFACDKPVELTVKLRHPWWAPTNNVGVILNGVSQKIRSVPSTWIEIKRTWKTGDTLVMTFPFALRTEGFRDNPHRVAFMSGPLVLCAEVRTNAPTQIFAHDTDGLLKLIKPVENTPHYYKCPPEIFPAYLGFTNFVVLEPFYKMHRYRKYAVYWDIVEPFQHARLED
jgi:DUF1680 family protein